MKLRVVLLQDLVLEIFWVRNILAARLGREEIAPEVRYLILGDITCGLQVPATASSILSSTHQHITFTIQRPGQLGRGPSPSRTIRPTTRTVVLSETSRGSRHEDLHSNPRTTTIRHHGCWILTQLDGRKHFSSGCFPVPTRPTGGEMGRQSISVGFLRAERAARRL